MLQIGYFSAARAPQDAVTVHRILTASRKANAVNRITGLLVAGGGRYLQVIEGPNRAVENLFRNIQADERHMAVTSFCHRQIGERSFKSWSMAFRRQTSVGEPSSFLDVLGALTTDLADTALERQITYFAQAVMVSNIAESACPVNVVCAA